MSECSLLDRIIRSSPKSELRPPDERCEFREEDARPCFDLKSLFSYIHVELAI